MSQSTAGSAELVTVPLALTLPLGPRTETMSSRSLRLPFSVPSRAHRWRLVLRNVNARTNTEYSGAVRVRTLVIGEGARNESGERTSSYCTSTARFPQGPRIILRDITIRELAPGWASDWVEERLLPGIDYLLALGYQTNGTPVQLSMGGGWRTDYSPMNAELLHDPTATRATRIPFDIRVEYQTNAGIPQDVVFGDSISAASDASIPVLEAPAAIAARTEGRIARLHTFGGAAFGEWMLGAWTDPNSIKWLDVSRYGRANRAIIALGNNDIHDAASLPQLQSRLGRMADLLRERVAPDIVACTITPRAAWLGTARESLRQQFNDWLRQFPAGIVALADTARAVEDSAGTGPHPGFHADGIHFNSAASLVLAQALIAPIAAHRSSGTADSEPGRAD